MTKILIADNSPLIYELVRQRFKGLRIDVKHASNGAQASALILSEKFDFAVIDVVLSGTTGEALAVLARDEGVPVLHLPSGHGPGSAPVVAGEPSDETRLCLTHLPVKAALAMLESLDIVRRVKAAEQAVRHRTVCLH